MSDTVVGVVMVLSQMGGGRGLVLGVSFENNGGGGELCWNVVRQSLSTRVNY